MNRSSPVLFIAVALSGMWTGASAQPASAPSSAPADVVASDEAVPLRAQIMVAEGLVQVREADDQPWLKAEVGMIVGQGAEFRTGPRSRVTCVVEPDQTFTLDRLGTVKLYEAMRTGKTVRTELRMEYGRTQLNVEAAGIEHDSKIRSPGSTLAVRGTHVALYDQPPFAPVAISYQGRATYSDARREVPIGGRREARLRGSDLSPASTALQAGVVDPQFAFARSPSEAAYIADQASRGGTLGFDSVAQIQTINGGAGPIIDNAAFASTLPGVFGLTIRWTGNADLNILGTHQAGAPLDIIINGFLPTEIAFPGYGLDLTASGGRVPFDHRGGPNGGTEIVTWVKEPPQGLYGISAQHTSGGTVVVRLAGFYKGQPVTFYNINDAGEFVKGHFITREIGPGGTVSGFLALPGVPELEEVVPNDVSAAGQSSRRVGRAAVSKSVRSPRNR